MRAYFEATAYCSTARLAADQLETKFPAASRRQTCANRVDQLMLLLTEYIDFIGSATEGKYFQ